MVMVNTVAALTLPADCCQRRACRISVVSPARVASLAAVDDFGGSDDAGDLAAVAGAVSVVRGRSASERRSGRERGRESNADAHGADTGHLRSTLRLRRHAAAETTVMTVSQKLLLHCTTEPYLRDSWMSHVILDFEVQRQLPS
jgi:hypothetical protein